MTSTPSCDICGSPNSLPPLWPFTIGHNCTLMITTVGGHVPHLCGNCRATISETFNNLKHNNHKQQHEADQ